MKNKAIKNGTVVTAKCRIQGSPVPKIRWLINNKLVSTKIYIIIIKKNNF